MPGFIRLGFGDAHALRIVDPSYPLVILSTLLGSLLFAPLHDRSNMSQLGTRETG